jgi:hypothetical protein
MRSRAKYLYKAEQEARVKEGLYAAERALLVASAYKPLERGRSAFDSVYSSGDAAKIAAELAKGTTHPERVATKVRGALPRRGLSLRSILLMLLLVWIPAADAAWNEWSAPPDENSLFDTLFFASYFVQLASGFAGKRLDPTRAAPALFLSDVAGKVGASLRAAGASQRFYNMASGKYPMDVEQKGYMGVELLAPLRMVGSDTLSKIVDKGELAQKAYTIKEMVLKHIRPTVIEKENKAFAEAIKGGVTEALIDVETVAGTGAAAPAGAEASAAAPVKIEL